MKILLVNPPYPGGPRFKGEDGAMNLSPPLNLLSLAEAVPEHDVDIVDLDVHQIYSFGELEETLGRYDLVGVTCQTQNLRNVLEICRLAKRKDLTTITGGFHPTLVPNIIDKFDCFDMLVRGEGEITFKALLDGEPKKEVLGLSYRENGKTYHNPDRPLLENLDKLPFPKNNLVEHNNYEFHKLPTWACETSRGCPFSCSFCCVTRFYKRTFRTKTPERVIEELLRVPDRTQFIFFADDNFTMNKKRVMRLCDLIRQNGLNWRMFFACQSRVDDIADNPDMVEKMQRSGFISFFLGFESLKQEAIDRMDKKFSVDKAQQCVEICRRNGISIIGSFIVGNIRETKEDVRRTFKMIKELDLDRLYINLIVAYPGTRLYDEALKNNWLDKEIEWENLKVNDNNYEDLIIDVTIYTPDFSKAEILEMVREGLQLFGTSWS